MEGYRRAGWISISRMWLNRLRCQVCRAKFWPKRMNYVKKLKSRIKFTKKTQAKRKTSFRSRKNKLLIISDHNRKLREWSIWVEINKRINKNKLIFHNTFSALIKSLRGTFHRLTSANTSTRCTWTHSTWCTSCRMSSLFTMRHLCARIRIMTWGSNLRSCMTAGCP